MDEQSRKLLQECSSGCKMGIDSMEQAREFVTDTRLGKVMDEYLEKNRELGTEIADLLKEAGCEEKEPGTAASVFSWLTTEVKLRLKDDSSQIAKVMIDGSNMGIQSLCKYMNEYKEASRQSTALAKKLVKTEEEFVKELEPFL